MTLTARPRLLIRFAVLAALALCGIVLALSSTGTPPVGAQDGSAPAKPTGVVTTATHDSVALAWDDPSDASITHYQIFRRDRDVHDAGEFVTIEENTGSAAASYTDDTVEPETSYVYRVKAVNQHGVSKWSKFARADTPAAPDPADLAPSGLEVSLVENRVTLSWDAPASDAASVTGYEILRRRPNEGEAALTTLVADTGNAETGYTDDTANEPGVGYTYRVRALRDGEQSRVSNYARIDLPDDYAQDMPEPEEEPSPEALAPSGLTAEAAKDGGVALSWTAPAEDAGSVTGYEVLRARGNAELTTLAADTGSTDTAYTDETATAAGETYVYQVKALRGEEKSQVSNRASITLPDEESARGAGDATGAPAISGTAQVGELLTADISNIGDPDGVANADFEYQWIADDGTTDSVIDGANSSTYTLVEDDAGNAVKVRVSFTDDEGNAEELTSGATAIVLPAPKVTVIEGEAPVGAFQEATVALVSNMNQTTQGSANSTTQDGAQAFTTGTNSLGYTLESVQISLTVGGSPFPAHTVSIWTESSNNPGSSLGTLTNPDPVVNGVNTYTTTDGISLSAGTTYFIVVDNSPNAGDSGRIAVTGSDSEDSGAASGWSIGDGRVYRDHDSTGTWGVFNNSLKIRINGQVIAPPPEVPADSSLVPDGLGPGDQFRLIFLSSETRTAEATDIATYNAWVQGLAANGHADIQDHSSTFRVVGSTAAVDARDNTSTTYTSSDKGVAIYWLNGDKAADDYEDFYDETWDEEASMRDESGTTVTAPANVWTGSDDDGTTTAWHLGSNLGNVTVGRPNSTITDDGPLSSGVANVITLDRHLYALSGVFQVGAIEVPDDWSLVPSGLQEGDQFRLLFISSTHRNASPSEIATYNTWVQDLAANGHTDIQDYSSSFRAVGSTEAMDARDNTGTTYTSSDKGVAIYWLGGNKVADDYEDFYDEDWDEEAAMKNESGTAETGVSAWTGSDHDGTEMLQGTPETSRALGNSNNAWVRFGKTDSTSHGPLSGATAARDGNKRIYGLSGVFEVVAANNPATGAPTITGTAQVGGVLTANLLNVTDPDGLDDVSYSYQWIADDGVTETDIDHATGETYRPITADEDKTVKVRVSFTDDEGNPESLTSAATGAVSAWDKGELIWSALLTVGEYDTGGPIVFGFTTGLAGSLEPPTFTFASTDITITHAFIYFTRHKHSTQCRNRRPAGFRFGSFRAVPGRGALAVH